MSLDDVITEVIRREGAGVVTDDPSDKGGRTQYGISERSNPEAWADGKVTEDEARAIYMKKYVSGPGFDKIPDLLLQHQLVDFGVNSGPTIAIRELQAILRVAEDGILGPATLNALKMADSKTVNRSLVKRRVLLLSKICVKNPQQLKFLVGWVNRAFEFLV